jgi:hypothetical protein
VILRGDIGKVSGGAGALEEPSNNLNFTRGIGVIEINVELAIFRLTKWCIDLESTNAMIRVAGGMAVEEKGIRNAWGLENVLVFRLTSAQVTSS